MKVLHIITSLRIGGAERLVADSVPVYQEKGLDTDVVILKDENTLFSEQLKKKTNGKLIFLTKGSVYNPLLIMRLIPLIRKYDVVHAHLFPVLYWVVFAKWLGKIKVPIVYTEHSTNNNRRNNIFFKYIERFVYSRLSLIGCISQGTKDELQKHLKVKLKLKLIHNGIDISKFKNIAINKEEYNFFEEDHSRMLIQVSSFREQKDQKTLVSALTYLPSYVKLLLVGEGPLKTEVITYVRELGLEDRVQFLGNREDIPELMSCSDIVILSSIIEGFGLVVVEGMAANKPVIASNIIGVSEIVSNYGLLFERGNAKDLTDKILSLLNSNSFYNNVKDKCNKRAEDYSIEGMVNNYIDNYKILCKI